MSDDKIPFEQLSFDEISENQPEKTEDRRFFKQEKKHRSLFERLMYDNRIVFLFSLICALAIWFYVALYAGDTVTRTISDIPVTINYEDSTPANLGLEMFGDVDYQVKVTVSGPRYRVSERSLSASDIVCTANLNYVNSAGVSTLDLRVTCNVQDVSIDSKSMDSIRVYFDKRVEKEILIEGYVGESNVNLAASGFVADTPVTSMSRITVSGPASEINNIEKIIAVADCSGNLSASVTMDATLQPVMTDETELKYTNLDEYEVTVTVPIRKIVTLPTTVTFTAIPADLRENLPKVTVSPSYVSCGVPAENADSVTELSVGEISFEDITNGSNTFNFDTVSGDITVIGDVSGFTATVDGSEFSEKEIEVELTDTNLIINGATGDLALSRGQQTITVTVVGTESELEKITADNVYIEVDLTNVEIFPGNFRVDCAAYIKNNNSCWVYGDYVVELSAMHSR